MLRNKRQTSAAQATLPRLSLPKSSIVDPLVDNLSHFLGEFGFRQVVLPPVAEVKHFPPWLSNSFVVRGSGSAPTRGEWGLWPTHLASIAKLYQGHYPEGELPRPVTKWFYILPVVARADERIAVTHELGIFVFGEESSLAHAHLVNVVAEVLRNLGLSEIMARIGSRGCATCQRAYAEALRAELPEARGLCQGCLGNLSRNMPAVWNCSNVSCQNVLAGAGVQMLDFLDESCRALLTDTLETVDTLEIPYVLSSFLPGHLAAEKIFFELSLGAAEGGAASGRTGFIGRGGNYSQLLKLAGADGPVPALGFSTSLETLAGLLPEESSVSLRPASVFIISLGSAAGQRAMQLYRQIQHAGISVAEGVLGNQGIRSQLRIAHDRKSEIALIIGQKEALDETVILRDIRSGMQEVFVMDRIVEEVQKRLAQ